MSLPHIPGHIANTPADTMPAEPPAPILRWRVRRDMICHRVTIQSVQRKLPIAYRIDIGSHMVPQVSKKVGTYWILWDLERTPGNVLDFALTVARAHKD